MITLAEKYDRGMSTNMTYSVFASLAELCVFAKRIPSAKTPRTAKLAKERNL
jgi:hypothetical protein